MKYIIMCGGNYKEWETPRHLLKIQGEEIVARTIRLLREHGVEDICISSDNTAFAGFGVQVLEHKNRYYARGYNDFDGSWTDAFYPTDEPASYIFGDVVFSEEGIRTIVETETDDIELFGSMPPLAPEYPKKWIEPFALKVQDQEHLKRAIQKTKELDAAGKFWRRPIMWELWTVIKDVPLQTKPDEYIYNYTAINDYTCDIDHKRDIPIVEMMIAKKRLEERSE